MENINDLWCAYEPVDDHGGARRVHRAVVAVLVSPRLFSPSRPWGRSARGDIPGLLTAVRAVAAVLAWFVVRRLSWRALLYHASLD